MREATMLYVKTKIADLQEKLKDIDIDIEEAEALLVKMRKSRDSYARSIEAMAADLAEAPVPAVVVPMPPASLEILDAILGHDKPFVDSVTTAEPDRQERPVEDSF